MVYASKSGVTPDPAIHGLNLIGNPFTCGFDWDDFTNDLGGSPGISEAIYFTKDNAVASYVGGVGTNSGTNHVPPMQGFFVKAYKDTTISISTGYREHNTTDRFKGSTIIPLVRLELANDLYGDEAVIRMDENATTSYDNKFDAIKFKFNSDVRPSIWSSLSGKDYVINRVPFPENSMVIPLVINSPKADSLKITATQIEGLEDYDLTLKDLDQNVNIDLNNVNEYSFFADSRTVTDRFILTVTNLASGLPDIFEPEPEKTFNIYSSRERLYISPEKEKWNGKKGDL